MKYIKVGFIALLLFVFSFMIGAYFSINKYPKKEFQRVVKGNMAKMGGSWKFNHIKEVVTSDFKTIVKPAVDFLYSSATLDAKAGAHILSIPPIDRYFTFQFMESDTDVFDYVGSRTDGQNKALKILIVPPNYTGETFGLKTIEMKTNEVWLLARFQVFGKVDAVNVHAIQDKVELIPIADYNSDSE